MRNPLRCMLWILVLCLAAKPAMACCVSLSLTASADETPFDARFEALPPCHQPQNRHPDMPVTTAAGPSVQEAAAQPLAVATVCPGCSDCEAAALTQSPLPVPKLLDGDRSSAVLPAAAFLFPVPQTVLLGYATGPPVPALRRTETPVTLKQRLLD